MKRHLNTLYITSPDAFIRKEGETFVVELDNKKALQAPVSTIENIVCFGFKPVTPALMAFCAENNIGISYLSRTGRFLARVYGEQKGNVLLRKEQYAVSDSDERSLQIAKNIVAAKIANSRNLLLRHIRNHGEDMDCSGIDSCVKSMAHAIVKMEKAATLDELRGHEGECASLYFNCFNSMITCQKEDFVFNGRSKRPPLDNVNALLSFTYMILVNDIRSALETTGLDPQVGFFHRLRPGRPSLALDLMEEFRAYIADRVVLNLLNLKQVTRDDFEKKETGEIRLSDKARKEAIIAYQKKKDEVITHPLLDERTTIGLLPHIQSMLLARFIRGDIKEYPPFYIK
ncbi:MAG: subtype I-C CRISPR-associated endonuclease Cas1 [Spirochaetes bacterium RBG_16_49_21]|nr:MAG: subtype I-C CRISPR-associated endonuclease Cas1 [Spirochaetes bacterium RBG_16_49_21]